MVELLVKKEAALKELGKFFALAGENVPDLMMPNSFIDEEWHAMLNDSETYEKFCLQYAGTLIKHEPSGGVDEFTWVKNYEQKYGKLNIIWFIDSSGTFNEKAYEEYIKNGIVKMSWDCKPANLHT
ncbi:hypothetical protein HRD76_11390 [Enterococcus faecalis]|uniref:hypothetical protein n=1 Tax=Enterococcus faecalis TaxID=1351 RepID=UPI00156F3A8E|nr:hypothetical protein [Enterococcus faecalis]NSV35904.1 hypothetical protein [Enterococcus faecalis]